MNNEYFKYYSVDEFILDEDFREIVRDSEKDYLFDELLAELPEKRAELNLAAQIIRDLQVEKIKQSPQRKKELWNQIVKKKQKNVRLNFLRYAATILVLLATGISVYYLSINNVDKRVILSKTHSTNDAMLILANGESISIKSKQSDIKYSADGSGVIINDSSGLIQSVATEGFNRLIVPYGKRSIITLSDGTKVWLNSGSTLVFPPSFKKNSREVYLVGEAFFDVSHNKEKPFYVKTDGFKVKVYGTKFDVKAYMDDKTYNIVLVEGKVSMNSSTNTKSKEVFLAPHQKATLTRGEDNFDITEVENMDNYNSWMEGYLSFSNTDVSELLKQVSRYYNINIDANNVVDVEKIYGKLDLKDNVERVLDGISFISKIKYQKTGNKYVFVKANN